MPLFYLSNKIKKIIYRLADSPLPAVLFIATLLLVRWIQNSDFQYPTEIAIPVLLFSVLVSAVFYGYRVIFGPGLATHVATLTLSFGFYNYAHLAGWSLSQFIKELIPSGLSTNFTDSLVLGVTAALAAGLLGFVLARLTVRLSWLQSLQPLKVILFTTVFIFGLQLARGGIRLVTIADQLSYSYPAISLPQPSQTTVTKPDIYYLNIDRYTSAEALKEVYKYDNSAFLNFLQAQGFVNRPSAYANYPFTMSSLSSTLAMNYFPDLEEKFAKSGSWQAAFPYRSILKNPPVAQALKQNGYNYIQVSSWSDYTRIGIKADRDPAISFRLNLFGWRIFLSDLERDIINKSILSPWLKKGLTVGDTAVLKYDLDRNPTENFERQMSALKSLGAKVDQNMPKFVFAHILAPHDPYIFDADGSKPNYDPNRTDIGVDEKIKYTNEITYLNKRFTELISHIRTNSPEAVIIIQPDEGAYPKQFRHALTSNNYYDIADLPLAELKQKQGILASYYMPGLPPNEVAKMDSSVNVFRFVLNRYLGYDLSMLPDCHFSTGNKFIIYDYRDITERLKNQPNPDCKDYLVD
ncbi:MAG: hypothetical protein WD877_02695 [Candidatus Saccharimonadales bacterium]